MSLAMQRTGEFEHNKKVIMCSTPTVDGESRIQAAWNASDQREYFVPCPLCNHFQILVFSDGTDGGLVWPEGEPEKAAYCCEKCRGAHPAQPEVVDGGARRVPPAESWVADSGVPGVAVDLAEAVLGNDRRGVPGRQASRRRRSRRSSTPCWRNCGQSAGRRRIGKRSICGARITSSGSCRRRDLLLVAGVDVQDDRLEVEIKAYGRGKESWSVDYRVIQVPDQAGSRSKRRRRKSGRSWKRCWRRTGRASRAGPCPSWP